MARSRGQLRAEWSSGCCFTLVCALFILPHFFDGVEVFCCCCCWSVSIASRAFRNGARAHKSGSLSFRAFLLLLGVAPLAGWCHVLLYAFLLLLFVARCSFGARFSRYVLSAGRGCCNILCRCWGICDGACFYFGQFFVVIFKSRFHFGITTFRLVCYYWFFSPLAHPMALAKWLTVWCDINVAEHIVEVWVALALVQTVLKMLSGDSKVFLNAAWCEGPLHTLRIKLGAMMVLGCDETDDN